MIVPKTADQWREYRRTLPRRARMRKTPPPPTPLSPERSLLAARYVALARSIAKPFKANHPRFRDEIDSAAMMALVEAAESYREGSGVKFSSWAAQIVRFRVADASRPPRPPGFKNKRKRMPKTFTAGGFRTWNGNGDGDGGRDPVKWIENGIECRDPRDDLALVDGRDAADRLLRKLPAKNREPLRLMAAEGLTQQGAADRLGWTQAEVSRLVLQSRKLLGGSPCSC